MSKTTGDNNTTASVQQDTTEQKTSNKSYSRTEIEGTPFTKIYDPSKGWFLVMGDYLISETFKTDKQLEAFLKKGNNWVLLTNVMAAMIDITDKLKQMQNAQTKGEDN